MRKAYTKREKVIQREIERSKLVIDPTRVTHLMKSIRVDMVPFDSYTPTQASVGIEPVRGSRNFVDLKIWYQDYRTQDLKVRLVRFYFDGQDPKEISQESQP